jgi:hypothetical protein
MVSGLGYAGNSSAGVTNGTSILWLRSNSANVVRNCEDGVTPRSWKLVHRDNAPLQSPRRPIIILYLLIFKFQLKDLCDALRITLKTKINKIMQSNSIALSGSSVSTATGHGMHDQGSIPRRGK